MIKFIVARQDNDELIYDSYIKNSIDSLPNIQAYNISGPEDIYQKYNKGIELISEIKEDDIICFFHNDVQILDPIFVEKLEYTFDNKKDVGLCGVVGTRAFPENGAWWLSDNNDLCGHIIQENGNTSYHLVKNMIGYFDDVVIVDGLFLAIRGKLLLEGLRFSSDLTGFHLYDVDICLKVLKMKYKVAVVDILLQHKSTGMGFLTQEWNNMKNKIIGNLKIEGCKFPLKADQYIGK